MLDCKNISKKRAKCKIVKGAFKNVVLTVLRECYIQEESEPVIFRRDVAKAVCGQLKAEN